MPQLPTTTAAALAQRARDLLKDAAELTSGRDPNYIRDAQPDSIFEAIPLAAARQGCRRYADKPDQYSGLRQARVERACRPYLDSLNYGNPPTIELPFRGGQCSEVYLVSTTTGNDIGGIETFTVRARGPLGGIRARVEGPTVFYELNCRGLNAGSSSCGTLADTGQGWYLLRTVTSAGGSGTSRINSATPCDGSDDCGNPVPVIEPPKPPPVPGPRREPFIRTPDVNIDIDVEVNPDLTIDIDFGTGPINIDPFGDGGGGGGGGGVGEPGTPEGTGQGGEAEGEAPDGSVLTGLRIDFVDPPVGGNEYAPGVYRAVCYIYMGTPDGLDHDPAGAMLRSGQFVYAEKDFLTRWAVSANMGYNLRVTPYYRPVEAEE